MKYYEVNVEMKVKIAAFEADDAKDAVEEALQDIDALGAKVLSLEVISTVEAD